MEHLINMEVINSIQMLDAYKVCAISMTEAFQRGNVLTFSSRGAESVSPVLGLCFCCNLLLETEGHRLWKAFHDYQRLNLMLFLGSYVTLHTLLRTQLF